MNAGHTAVILRELERGDSDVGLLSRFAADKDAQAFAELVRRHGPLVLGVCRRVTGHPQDAEDAFQATFLVLAKKAGAVKNPELLASYLYGVAFRVALRVKRSALRRKAREVLMASMPDPPAPAEQPAASDLRPLLDQELSALAECYRDAIVLCDLRGVSREDAAIALGIPEGTLSSRLANGRKKLAARLARRGVSLSAALPLLTAEASAAVPNELITKTCGLVASWASGGGVPVALSKLASGGLHVRTLLVLGAVFAAGAVGAVFASQPRPEAPPTDPPKPPVVLAARAEPAPPKDAPKEQETPAAGFTDKPRMLRSFDAPLGNSRIMRWSADGTHIALHGFDADRKTWAVRIYPVEPRGRALPIAYPDANEELAGVRPDGSGVVTALREHDLISGNHRLTFWNPPNKPTPQTLVEDRTVALALPVTEGYAFSADMKTFRTVAHVLDARGTIEKLEVLEADATTEKATKSLLTVTHGPFALSANGKRLARFERVVQRVDVFDLDRGAKVASAELTDPVPGLPDRPNSASRYVVLSPDGSRVVVFRGPGRTAVFDGETGKALPQLEGTAESALFPDKQAFSGDGRLLAATGVRYKTAKVKGLGGREQTSWEVEGNFLGVWDTQTGKALKTWDRGRGGVTPYVAFNPARPLLAIMENNGENRVRVGFWDFAAEVAKK
jgi:RNA polymerase sigma factor (sigma-70 family)